ncbi:MAG: DUF2587 domain-containing protein [Euzebyales bacterium]|nr:DUF2587 domain-containing protein [Euzebyales bacterium]MDQ3432525.1 bacterial proteasome activator family protein [Actinomycetota bacterium]
MTDNVEVVSDQKAEEHAKGGITEPGKLMRIAVMLRELQGEVRRASPDQAGRDRLKVVHERALGELCEILSPDLQQELGELSLPFEHGTPTESEILISQAQLVGWLEGLFQGIQAAMFNQQMQMRQQFESLRQRGLPQGAPPGQEGETPQQGTGQYL